MECASDATLFVPFDLFNPPCRSTQERDVSLFYIHKDDVQRNKEFSQHLSQH